MNYYKPYRRLLAMVLSVIMALGISPVSAAADSLSIGSSGEIISFEALPEEMASQTVPLGTSLEELDLPETLTATVRVATASDADMPKPGSSIPEPQESEESNQSIPVTWVSEPEYNPGQQGEYIFAPQFDNVNTLVGGVSVPWITVIVAGTPVSAAHGMAMPMAAGSVDGENYAFDAGTGTLTIKTNDGAVGSGMPTSWRRDTNFTVGDVQAVVFLDGVTNISYGSFKDCPALVSVTIPSSVTLIRSDAFNHCAMLSSVTMPDSGLISIEYSAFAACTSLTSLTLPSTVGAIGQGAFGGCTGLTLVLTSADAPSFGDQLWALNVPKVCYPAAWGTSVPNLNAQNNAYGIIGLQAIPGVAAPAQGAMPVNAVTETPQYTGTVTWSLADKPFQGKHGIHSDHYPDAQNGLYADGRYGKLFHRSGCGECNQRREFRRDHGGVPFYRYILHCRAIQPSPRRHLLF